MALLVILMKILAELGISDILCTSSVKAIKDINPKLIVLRVILTVW